MSCFALFTDVSVNPRLKLGVGAYLLVPSSFLEISQQELRRSEIVRHLALKRFKKTSSTQLEVQTVLLGLEDCLNKFKTYGPGRIKVYTDSQCVTGLLKRRPLLEANGFVSQKTNSLLMHAAIYRRFFDLFDELEFEVIKVAGHSRSCSRDTVHRLFSSVDMEARKELKLWMNEFEIRGVE